MAQSRENNWQTAENPVDAWASAAREPYQTIRYAGVLHARSKTRHQPLKPVFAMGASLIAVAAVWMILQNPVPDSSGSEWKQPSSPTSARDLSSLTRGLRQNIPGGGELVPQKPQTLKFRMPGRPPAERSTGFSQPTETSGVTQTDARSYS